MKLSQILPENIKGYNDIEISGITSDSRKVKEGFAFVCIDGALVDGHNFSKSAEENGAGIIIAEKPIDAENLLIVEDTKELFFSMCLAWFGNPLKNMKLIGITGTNGKTSTTYMLKSILENEGKKCGLIGTIQHLIGDKTIESKNTTPGAYEICELLAMMRDEGCEYAIMEVSSHALEQKRICGVTFDVGMFTNLTQDHLDYHKTIENYLLAKKKLFSMSKVAVINYDDEAAKRMVEGEACEVISYSTLSDETTYSAKGITYKADGVEFEFVGFGLIGRIKLSTGGLFTVYNALCAISCALALGVPLLSCADALSKFQGVKGRAEVVPTGRDFHIIIDYAHTPDGLENILNTFLNVPHGRIVTLFGCGGDRDKTKRPIMGEIAARLSDFVIVTSDNPRSENPSAIIKDIVVGIKPFKTPYVVIENRIDAIKYAIEYAKKDDIIILAGKGHETYQILNTGTIHLDEREIVRDALEEIK